MKRNSLATGSEREDTSHSFAFHHYRRRAGYSVHEVIGVVVVEPYMLDVTFRNGEQRRVDLGDILWGPMFEPLHDPAFFAKAHVNHEFGTVVWPNDADIAPEYLYTHGKPLTVKAPI